MAAIGFPKKLGQAQRERLAHIDFRLWFLGEVSRADICLRFGVAPAGATRDLAKYREAAPGNIAFDGRTKTYRIRDSFVPVFEHPIHRVLSSLSLGFGDGIGGVEGPMVPCEFPTPINRPATETLARVTRAIASKVVLRVVYFSASGGKSTREIIPFALVDNGLRWHVRAFDRRTSSFRDFVITRILAAEVVDGDLPGTGEMPDDDAQWTRMVELELVAHPDSECPELATFDYPMVDGVLFIRVRAALAGYVLRRWNVDCSTDHRMRGPEYTLWLRDSLALYGVESAAIAPGYRPPGNKDNPRG